MRRKPIKRTLLTAVFALATLAAAFVWLTAATGPLNTRGTNAIITVWHGSLDIMVAGLHSEYPRVRADRSLRLSPALVKGYRLPAFWYQHDRPDGNLRIQIPLFIPLAVLLAWTAWGWTKHRRRRGKHECVSCGYPRLGLNTPNCPECGRAATDTDRSWHWSRLVGYGSHFTYGRVAGPTSRDCKGAAERHTCSSRSASNDGLEVLALVIAAGVGSAIGGYSVWKPSGSRLHQDAPLPTQPRSLPCSRGLQSGPRPKLKWDSFDRIHAVWGHLSMLLNFHICF